MKGFKDKKGKFHPTGKHSGLKKSDLQKRQVRTKDTSDYGEGVSQLQIDNMHRMRSEEAIDYIHDNYLKIMRLTANKKGGIFTEGKVQRFVGEDDDRELENVEAFCGATTDALETLLEKEFGKSIGHAETGYYTGDDRKHSESFNFIEDQVKHEWYRLEDGTIIDNACGQFHEDNLNTDLDKEQRLRIIRPDDERQDLYRLPHTCSGCGSHLEGEEVKCRTCESIERIEQTPEFKSGMALVEVSDLYRSQGRIKELGLLYKKTL